MVRIRLPQIVAYLFLRHVLVRVVGGALEPSAILSVYEWIANNLLNLFVDFGLNNLLGERILMQSHSIPDICILNRRADY